MQHLNNTRQDLKPLVALDTRGQQAVGGRALRLGAGPCQNANHNHSHSHNHGHDSHQNNGGGQGRGQHLPQNTPRGPKNPHTQSYLGQGCGRKTHASSQTNHPCQNSGTDTPRRYPANGRWYQSTPNNRGHGAKTPAHTQDDTSHGGFGGRTPATFANREASQSWGGRNPHPSQHARPIQTLGKSRGQPQRLTGRGATGVTHHRFEEVVEEEEVDSMFL
jgi:hypothetical protein